jgi:predicted nucleotidyltransferase
MSARESEARRGWFEMIKKELVEFLRARVPGVKGVRLVGSSVNGHAIEGSDVDVVVTYTEGDGGEIIDASEKFKAGEKGYRVHAHPERYNPRKRRGPFGFWRGE